MFYLLGCFVEPGTWLPGQSSVPAIPPLWRDVRAVGAGAECAPTPTWPEEPKIGRGRPARHRPPGTATWLRTDTAPCSGPRARRVALPKIRGQPRPGALRAP